MVFEYTLRLSDQMALSWPLIVNICSTPTWLSAKAWKLVDPSRLRIWF
jgi:hypothetical protein